MFGSFGALGSSARPRLGGRVRFRRLAGPVAAGFVLAAAAGCASSTAVPGTIPASGSGAASTASASATASASPSAAGTPGASGSATSGGGSTTTGSSPAEPLLTPQAQVQNLPAGTKYVMIISVQVSPDGRTLYADFAAGGGACGLYDTVLQQSGGSVSVGVAHLPKSGAGMCPDIMSFRSAAVQLSAPLAGRTVVDLSDGRTLVAAGS